MERDTGEGIGEALFDFVDKKLGHSTVSFALFLLGGFLHGKYQGSMLLQL